MLLLAEQVTRSVNDRVTGQSDQTADDNGARVVCSPPILYAFHSMV